ncbi:unnamed protein product [Trifolium pratense]|uniref:Uncharacterized protein n=1 Tax=Trifolium pratense TaxID=57577 RepID=A0ACB0LLR7_TRIPR|nr:unnamed protein product [Trifolium pratense]
MPPLVTEIFKTETLEENGKGEKVHGGAYPSKAEIRKSMRRARNGPGLGYLLDSCTINPSENEALVRYALDKYKYLSLAPQEVYASYLDNLTRWDFLMQTNIWFACKLLSSSHSHNLVVYLFITQKLEDLVLLVAVSFLMDM